MTRDDVIRRLAHLMVELDSQAEQPWSACDVEQKAKALINAEDALTCLAAIAREPGGAEAVAEAVGGRAWVDGGRFRARIVAAEEPAP